MRKKPGVTATVIAVIVLAIAV
ncbi:MAG: hypothetical protein JWM74_3152, partial [Myxococcaceae bacterium]|nr:hypothetical protein [Myxococcaceae bacterium]